MSGIISGSMTWDLATKEELMAWKGERRSRWPAETAVKCQSGTLLTQHIRNDNIPAAMRAIGAKRKARIIDNLCGEVKEGMKGMTGRL